IKTSGVPGNVTVTITGAQQDNKHKVTLNIQQATLTSFDQGTVQLTGVAPPGGAVIALKSDDPAHASVPPSITVSAGSDKVGVAPALTRDYSAHDVKISATWTGVTKSYNQYVSKN